MQDGNHTFDIGAILPSFSRVRQFKEMMNKNLLINTSQEKNFRNQPQLVMEFNWSSSCLIC